MFVGIGISAGTAKRGAASGPSGPATEGPHYPGTVVDDAGVGTVAWSNPSFALTDDGAGADASLNNNTSHYLKATDFGFAVPGGATIDGVIVEIEKRDLEGLNSADDSTVRLIVDGVVSGDNKADTSPGSWPGAFTVKTYGGEADLWGLALTAADVNASDFGVVISARDPTGDGPVLRVDFIRVTIHYST